MWDWDGCLVDTMPAHADLAAKCIQSFFGMKFQEARKAYLATTGIPFDKQLEKIFPLENESARKACADVYHKEKIKMVYGNPQNFPETIQTVQGLESRYMATQVISSSTEESLIQSWVEKFGLINEFRAVYGREHGSKVDHIKLVRQQCLEAFIVFISDSPGDMDLPADCTIGVQSTPETENLFFAKGAAYVINGPVNTRDIYLAIEKCVFFQV